MNKSRFLSLLLAVLLCILPVMNVLAEEEETSVEKEVISVEDAILYPCGFGYAPAVGA